MPPKGKAAKSKADVVDAEEAREVLRLLDDGAAPLTDTLHKVFRLNLGPCSASCGKQGSKGSKDNPCCFHGLIPAEGGFRKKGLWQKEPVLGQLGHDPADDRRMAPSAPAGLRNLGNTCYVNAAMQFLHSLPAFRNALYMLEPELAEQQIVKQMRDLFIEMHFGPKRYVDPEPFANSLLLDHAIQQDGQEFLKLLLSKLEGVFGASQREDVATVVQDLFQGHLSHVTTCHTCQRPSEGSKREVEFYELSLQVQQMPTLHHSLVAALAPDELMGDNQYFCDYCAAKSDADRRMRLRSLPPYLCLALQRFTYDYETWEKKKVLHKLSIPLQLNMGQVLQDAGLPLPEAAPLGPDKQPVLPGSPNSVYELAAVLIHKGTSASHGHYVAHIKLHDTGTWWRFDDEEAVEMGLQPTSHPQDHGTTAAAAAAAANVAATSGQAAAAGSVSADESSKPAVGKKRGRGGGGAGGAAGAKRGKGASRGGRGGRKAKGRKKEEWDSDSEADAEAEAATAAAEEQADEDAQLRAALQMSRLEASVNGDVDMSAEEVQATIESAAELAAQTTSARSRSGSTAAVAPTSSRGRGRGRGKGRAKGKAAAAAAAEGEAAAVDADAAGTPAAAHEQAGSLPQAIVDQIMSANAYFLVYRHCPEGSQQPSLAAAVAETAAIVAAADQAAAVLQEQQQQQQESGQQQPLQARDQNVQPEQQQQADTKQEPGAQQPVVVQHQPQQQHSEQQLLLAAQQLQAQLQELPEAVQQQVAQLHKDFNGMCEKFEQRKQEALTAVAHRKEEVNSIAQLLPVAEGDPDGGCFICLNWLDGWANSEGDPDPVDNSVLLCQEHRKLNPMLPPGTVKYVSQTAWQQLQERHRGGPRLTCSDVCHDCLKRLLQGLVDSEDLGGLRDQLLCALDVDEDQQDRRMQACNSHYVSKTWMLGFRRRTGATTRSSTLEPPTAGIACPHGRLAPEARSGAAKRFAVSRDTWALLTKLWPQQVLWDVQARLDKAKRAAVKRTVAGGVDAAAVAEASKDDDAVVIMDSPKKDKLQPQAEVQVINDTDTDADVIMEDADNQQQQHNGAADRTNSPGAAEPAAPSGLSSWQLPFPLDGSVPLSESMLLEALPVFTVLSEDCQECTASLQEAAAGHQEVKQQLEGQRQALGKLLAGNVTEALQEGVTYYLVPNSWLDTWRKHLQAALSKKLVMPAQLPPAPEPLPAAIMALMCKCHPPDQPLLAVTPPKVANKRGRFTQADPLNDALRVVTEQDWQQLLLHYSGLDADGQQAAAAATVQHQHRTAAASDSSRPTRRRSGRAAEQHKQQDAGLDQQEQQDLLQQRIASLVDTHPGFRGVRAWLKVAATEMQEHQQQQRQELEDGEVQQPEQVQHITAGQPGAQQGQEALMNGLSTEQGQLVAAQEEQQQPAVQTPAAGTEGPGGGEAVDLTTSPPHDQRRSKRPRKTAVLDLSNSPPAKAAAEADFVVLDEPAEQSSGAAQAVHAAAQANGHPDDVQVVDMGVEKLQDKTAAGQGRQPGTTAAASRSRRQAAQSASGARAVAAARLRRPTARITSAGVAAAVEAAASEDSLEAIGSDTEAIAVAAAAAAAAAQRGWLETVPGLCEATLQAEAAARREATLVYTDAELMVELIAEEELQAAFSAAGGGERRSRRARKNRQPVKASGTDTLAMLKLKVFEVLSVHPANQRLYVRGHLLEGEDLTLAKLEVFPDEEIRVVNANQVPDDEYASVFDGVTGKRKAREVEVGFKDTALHGNGTGAGKPAATPAGNEHDLALHGGAEGVLPEDVEQQEDKQGK